MKSTIVPAQITSVEDTIAGSLSLMQILILLTPLFLSTVIFIIFPPVSKIVLYKFLLMLITVLLFLPLALRIKGKVLLLWIILFISYAFRPRYYIFTKNSSLFRDIVLPVQTEKSTLKKPKENMQVKPIATIKERITLQRIIDNADENMRFRFGKKGGIRVALSQIK